MKYLLMDSEYCSMGRWISWIVAEEFNMKMYEAEDIAENIEWLGKEKLNNFYARIACMEIEDIKKDAEFIKIKEALTQKEVADMLGISQSYISRLEKKIIGRLRTEVAEKI